MDIDKAKNNFLRNFERLSRLPLITDDEMQQLFGEEVKSALSELECYDQQEKLCAHCISRCCLLVDCELYTPELSCCPIHSFRPLLCRMHFCNRFALAYPSFVKEIGDIFLESLLAAERQNKKKAALFDSPPLGQYAPELVAAITSLIVDFKKGRLDDSSALEMIQAEVEHYYTIR